MNKENPSWSNRLSLARLSHVKKISREFNSKKKLTSNKFRFKISDIDKDLKISNIDKDLKYYEAKIPAKINWNSCKKLSKPNLIETSILRTYWNVNFNILRFFSVLSQIWFDNFALHILENIRKIFLLQKRKCVYVTFNFYVNGKNVLLQFSKPSKL